MLKALEVANYKSIKSLSTDLRSFNCLVGANNSGKSNVFDVFSFLSEMAERGLDYAVQNRSNDKLRFYGAPKTEPIRISVAIEGLSDRDKVTVRYSLAFLVHPTKLHSESLDVTSLNGETTNLLTADLNPEGNLLVIMKRGNGPVSSTIGGLSEPTLFQISTQWGADAAAYAVHIRRYLGGFRSYKFVPDALKSLGSATRTERLARDGSNFASYLHDVHSRSRRHFDHIQDQLVKSFPDIEELMTPLSERQSGTTELGIREKWFKDQQSGTQLSDGLAGFLAHLVVIYGPDEPTFVTFEEPENYINPRLLQRLVQMLKEASKSVQVAISTHSPSLLNFLDLDDIIVIDRRDGGTTATRIPDQKKLRAALADWAIGDAYVSGALEDVASSRDSH